MDFSIIIDSMPLYFEGLWLTLQLVFLSLVCGFVIAVPLGVLRSLPKPIINAPIRVYVYVFRGTPLLVQLYILYYGFGQFEFLHGTVIAEILGDVYLCGFIAFTLNTAAYVTEIIRGAIVATPFGEIEAAKSVGMSYMLMLRRIILPSAFRRALPAYGNEVIFMLHGSAVISILPIMDLTGAARLVNSTYYSPYEAFLTVAAFYLVLTMSIVFLFKQVEKRWFAHLKPRS